VRHTAPFVRVGEVGVPSLGVAAVMLGGARAARGDPARERNAESRRRVGAARAREHSQLLRARDARAAMLIRYTGPVLKDGKPTYQDYSFYDLF